MFRVGEGDLIQIKPIEESENVFGMTSSSWEIYSLTGKERRKSGLLKWEEIGDKGTVDATKYMNGIY